jgi:hypothetical protein
MPPHAAPSVRTIRKPPCQRSHCPHSSRPDMSWNSRPMNPPSISSPRWPGAHSMPVSPAHPNREAVLSAADIAGLRKVAEADPRVAALLGERWGFIDADRVPPRGKVSFGCCRTTARFTRLTYFSYSHNVAAHVHMKDSTILEASRAEGVSTPRRPPGHPTGHRAGSRRPPSRRQGARDARTRAVDAAGSRFLQKRPRVWTSGDLDHLLPWSGRRPQILGTSRSHGRPCAGCRK